MRRGYYRDPRAGGGSYRNMLEEQAHLANGWCRHGAHPEKCKSCKAERE